MTDENVIHSPAEELATALSDMVEQSKAEIASRMFERLHIFVDLPPLEEDKLKEQLKRVAGGNREDIEKFVQEVEAAARGAGAASRGAANGGVTKFVANWWGWQLYISHDVLEKVTSFEELIAALAGLGVAVAVLASAASAATGGFAAAALVLLVAEWKLADWNGDGIILNGLLWQPSLLALPQ